MHSTEQSLKAAEGLLAARFGGSPELTNPEDLGGSGASLVLRCRVSPNPFLQERTIVIKRLPKVEEAETADDAPVEFDADELALIREIVAYQYTNTLPEKVRPGPLLLAYDVAERMLILSDAGDGANFTEVLQLPDASERRSAVRKLGRALGRMHATSFGDAASYQTLLKRQCQKFNINPGTVVDSDIDIANLINEGIDLVRGNNIEIDETVLKFAREAMERQGRPDVRSFTPFDLTPDNIMVHKQVVFLDFEWASFRDIALDVACVIVGFPQDDTTPALTDEECTEFLTAWTAEIGHVWPTARDADRVAHVLMATLIGWAFISLNMLHQGQQMSRKATRRVIYAEEPAQSAPRDLLEMLPEQASDMATTVDAINRFALRFDNEDFEPVVRFTQRLKRALARQGGHPMTSTSANR
ncbi:phosphotransferase [Corynebacterium dentalis]|uniref:phosphotransferase n=1 Tax=Corynebacterium dentalis TaxID=2014528 RepID=UPI000C0725DD|nr:phosphotransferase [Corynebacterium dentalis]